MGHRSDPERVKLMMRELQSVLCLEFPSCDGPSVLSEAMNSAQTMMISQAVTIRTARTPGSR